MTDYDIFFLSKLIPPYLEAEVTRKSRHNMEAAANALQWQLIKGIDGHNRQPVQLGNLMPVGSFPRYYSDWFVRSTSFAHREGATDWNIGFCNLCYLKQLVRGKRLRQMIREWSCQDKGRPKVLITYTLDHLFLDAVRYAKRYNSHLIGCAIIADLPHFLNLSRNKRRLLRLYQKYQAERAHKMLDCLDGFVLLTAQMREYLKITQASIVIEGVAPDAFTAAATGPADPKVKILFYAGTLHAEYGILNLLEAFRKINQNHYQLVICGIGDSEAAVSAACQEDRRIRYYGQLPRREVLSLMAKATVLVNPRPNKAEFTKYSFPSKNMEYLASGRPLVAYKLAGIPDEYDAYIHYIQGDTPEDLKAKLIEVCEQSPVLQKRFGQAARDFVLSRKNRQVQAGKILNLIAALHQLAPQSAFFLEEMPQADATERGSGYDPEVIVNEVKS